MKTYIKTSIYKKIAIILFAILICYFIIPSPVNAASWLANAGGTLIDWVLQLFMFLGDSILNLLQNNFISSQDVIIQAEAGSTGEVQPESLIAILLGVVVIVIAICVAVASFGTLSAASFAAVCGSIKVIGGVVLAAAGGTALFVTGVSSLLDGLSGKFDLPMIRYTPYEIFSGQIPIFDVNFLNPKESVLETVEGEKKVEIVYSSSTLGTAETSVQTIYSSTTIKGTFEEWINEYGYNDSTSTNKNLGEEQFSQSGGHTGRRCWNINKYNNTRSNMGKR